MRLPSVKTLSRITDKPKTLRIILENYRDGKTCNARMTLCRADEIMGGYGPEYIGHKDDDHRYVYGFEYVNMGDTYTMTLCFDHGTGRFLVCSWGALVESAPHGTYP